MPLATRIPLVPNLEGAGPRASEASFWPLHDWRSGLWLLDALMDRPEILTFDELQASAEWIANSST